MDFFIDKQNLSLYITTHRNGSTLLSEIASVVPYFSQIDFGELLDVLIKKDKSTPIYAPIRDPFIRFKSGLSVNLFNRSDCRIKPTYDNMLDVFESVKLEIFKYMLIYLDNSAGDPGKLLSAYPIRPFHLYDSHCDHWLGSLMLFPAIGFNLQPIRLDHWSKHLSDRFGAADDVIKKRERPDSFNVSTKDYEKLWDIYKEVFIERIPDYMQAKIENEEKIITFDEWMSPELSIFNMMLRNNGSELSALSNQCFNNFLDQKLYYNDLHSPNVHTTFYILRHFSDQHLLTNSRAYEFLSLYNDIKEKTFRIHNIEISDICE